MMGVSLGILVLLAVQAGAEDKKKSSRGRSREKPLMSADAFLAKVAATGGRADFIFEDDRPFAECHASTIAAAADGTLISAWFAGTEEKDPDVGIWMARFENGAWSKPGLAAKVKEEAHWNPVLFRDAENTIHLFFKVGVDVPAWSTWLMSSEDGGKTWNEAKEIVPGDIGGRGPVKNKPIILSDGAWLAPASVELNGAGAGKWLPFADRSEDRGKTWQRSKDWAVDAKTLRGKGAIQPTFWESEPGKVHALMRTTCGSVWRCDSADHGKTWKPVYAIDLPNNNSGLDVLGLEDGRVLLIYNPVGMNWGPRTPLTLAVSSDNGKTWVDLADLEDNPDRGSEFSYPSMIRTKGGVAICYTWHRQRVRCWQIPMEALVVPKAG